MINATLFNVPSEDDEYMELRRQMVDDLDINQYQNEKVIIKGCASVMVPTWAYLILTAQLAQVADKIYYGEPRYAVKVFNRKEN